MRYGFLGLVLAAILSPATDSSSKLTWQGYISSGATLFIQGDQVDVQGRTTGAVDRPSYKFTSPLSAVRQQVTVQVRRGRGRVRVTEQPVPANDFTAVVEINSPGQRPEFFVLDFSWHAGSTPEGAPR